MVCSSGKWLCTSLVLSSFYLTEVHCDTWAASLLTTYLDGYGMSMTRMYDSECGQNIFVKTVYPQE